MKKIIICFILATTIGFFIGRTSVAPTPLVESESSKMDSELYNLEQRAKKDLTNAETLDQKLKEIQKLREEIFQIFLANIALKVDKNFWNKVDLSPQPLVKENITNPEPKIEAKPILVENIGEVKKESSAAQSEEHSIPYDNRSGILKDPNAYFSSSKLITTANNRLMQRIQGIYKGDAKMSEPRNKIWKISINSSLNFVEKNWSGNVSIEMANEDNVIFSNTNGSGSNNYFYQDPNDQGSLIVQASPSTFLYLKWVEGRQVFVGSVYKKTEKDKNWKVIGKIPFLAKE